MTDSIKSPVRPRDVQEPLLTSDELNALMKQDLPKALPQGFTSGVNAFFELMEKVAEARPGASDPFGQRPDGAGPNSASKPFPPPPPTPAKPLPAVAAPGQPAAAEPDRAAESRDSQTLAPDLMSSPMAAELAPPGSQSAGLAFGEILLLFGLAVGVEWALTEQVGSFDAHPHPYWLIVLPLAAARGMWTGLAAATLAATLHTLGAARALTITEFAQLLDHAVMREPILFGLAAFLIGQFRDDLLLRYRKLWRFLEHQSQEAARIAADNAELRERNQSYQAKLLDHSAQFGNLIDVARRLELADEHEIYRLALDMLKEHCGATRCSVLMVVARGEGDAPDQLELVTEHGWPEPTIHLHLQAAARSSLVRKCVREATPVSGFDPATPPPKDGPILVAPVFDEHTVLAAVLCMEELPADRYSTNLESMFLGVAEWTTVSLARVRAGRKAQQFTPQTGIETAEVWLGSAAELGDRLRLEDARCTQQGLVTSLITLQATELTKTDAQTLADLDARIRELATGSLRSSDTLFQFGYPGCWVAVLPDTPLTGAKVVCQRLSRRLRMTDSGALGAVAIDALAPNDDHPSLRKLLAPLAERFRSLAGTPLDTRCPVVVPERGEVGDAVAFVRRVRVELDLAMRSDYELFVVSLWLANEDARQREIFAQQIEQQHGRLLRSVDAVFRLGANHFALVLPDAAGAVAFTLVGELLDVLGARLSPEVIESVQQEVFALSGMPGEAQRLIDRLVAQSHLGPAKAVAMSEPEATAAPVELGSALAEAEAVRQSELARIFGGEPEAAAVPVAASEPALPVAEAAPSRLDAALAAALGAPLEPEATARADAALAGALVDVAAIALAATGELPPESATTPREPAAAGQTDPEIGREPSALAAVWAEPDTAPPPPAADDRAGESSTEAHSGDLIGSDLTAGDGIDGYVLDDDLPTDDLTAADVSTEPTPADGAMPEPEASTEVDADQSPESVPPTGAPSRARRRRRPLSSRMRRRRRWRR